jgi:hypothetical protein
MHFPKKYFLTIYAWVAVFSPLQCHPNTMFCHPSDDWLIFYFSWGAAMLPLPAQSARPIHLSNQLITLSLTWAQSGK